MSTLPQLPHLDTQQTTSPLEQYAQLLQIKNAQANQQFQQQQRPLELQSAQAQNQIQQQQLHDMQVGQKALQASGGDYNKYLDGLRTGGVSPQTYMQAQKSLFDLQNDKATLDKTTLENQSKQFDQFQAHADGIQQALSKGDQDTALSLAQDGIAKAEQAGILPPGKIQPQALLQPGAIDSVKSMLGFQSQITKQALDKVTATKDQAQTAEAQATAQKTTTENENLQKYGGLTPAMAESRYLSIQTKKNQGQPVSPDDQAFAKGYEHNKTLNTQFQFNLQNGGVNGGANGQPSAMAQMVASGQSKWSDVISPRTPMAVKEAFAKEVRSINPNFNSGDFDVDKKTKEAFTSGNYSQQLNAINTARNHMQTFSQLADALNNNDVQAANKIGNAVGIQFGNDRATNFRIAAQAFGGEVGKAFDGAGVTQSERESAASAFNPNMSPSQLRGAVQTVDSLLSGKQKALQQTYNQGVQAKPNFGQQNSQQAAPGATPSATGPNGHKIVVENGRWVDAQTHQPI